MGKTDQSLACKATGAGSKARATPARATIAAERAAAEFVSRIAWLPDQQGGCFRRGRSPPDYRVVGILPGLMGRFAQKRLNP